MIAKSAEATRSFAKELARNIRDIWGVEEGSCEEFCLPFLDILIYKGPGFAMSGVLD
jgi:hypothetical protein